VLVTQLPKLCGFSVSANGVVDGGIGFARGVVAGEVNLPTLAIGVGCLAGILALRAASPKVPGVLLAIVAATAIVGALHLEGKLQVVGAMPRGLPLPSIPRVRVDDIGPMFVGAIGIALVSFADTSVLSRTFAARHGHRVDPNRELVALGLANVAAGLLRGFPVSSSASRTPVAESAGAATQLTGVVGATCIGVILVAAPALLTNLPMSALAAVVIAAAISLFDVRALGVFYRVRRSDFVLSMIALAAVASLGVIPGIGAAVVVSILDFVRRAWRPHDAILGRADGIEGYHDVARYPGARQVPGLLLFRWDAPLFFANAELFRTRVVYSIEAAASPVQWVVVAAEPITDVDTTAAEMIRELDTELAARGVELAFAELKDPVKDRLHRYGLKAKIGHAFFFPTVGVAVRAFLETHGELAADAPDEARSDKHT
ncbi:MAG: SulP family inorganic anion transporter, partial [Polyangiales bacterium]